MALMLLSNPLDQNFFLSCLLFDFFDSQWFSILFIHADTRDENNSSTLGSTPDESICERLWGPRRWAKQFFVLNTKIKYKNDTLLTDFKCILSLDADEGVGLEQAVSLKRHLAAGRPDSIDTTIQRFTFCLFLSFSWHCVYVQLRCSLQLVTNGERLYDNNTTQHVLLFDEICIRLEATSWVVVRGGFVCW